MSNKLVCLDSMIFSWVFRDKEAPVDHTENYINYKKAKSLVKSLTKSNHHILVPRIVLSESLCKLSEIERIKKFNQIEKLAKKDEILIADVDFKTSLWLAKILHHRYHVEAKAYKDLEIETDKGPVLMTKVMMKYDTLILASAIAHGAKCLYTNDKGFIQHETDFIEIRRLGDSIDNDLRFTYEEEE